MNFNFYFSKIISKIQIPSFKNCQIDSTAKVYEKSALTNVELGRYSYIGKNTKVTNASIGKFCSIGGNCDIGGGLHPLDMVSTSPCFLSGKSATGYNFSQIPFEGNASVTIGNDVWIGSNVYIKAGVKIGDGAVIGAHSVVTKDIEPYSVVAGVPARLLRMRFNEQIVSKLLKIKWWDMNDLELVKYSVYFDNPEKLIEVLKDCDE